MNRREFGKALGAMLAASALPHTIRAATASPPLCRGEPLLLAAGEASEIHP